MPSKLKMSEPDQSIPPKTQESSASKAPPRAFIWVMLISTPVIWAAAATMIYLTAYKAPEGPLQYRLGLALSCFTLSTISGLIFATTDMHLKSTIGLIAIRIGGPAVTWIVTFVLVSYLYPEPKYEINNPTTVDALLRVAGNVEQNSGWETFDEWKGRLGTLGALFQGEEELSNVKALLAATFMMGKDRMRPAHAEVTTLFVYFPPPKDSSGKILAMKLQRITGVKAGKAAEVYAAAAPSTKDGIVMQLLFMRDDNGVLRRLTTTQTDPWHFTTANTVDAFMVALYEDPKLVGDWLQIHTPKYVNDGSAVIRLGIASQSLEPDPKSIAVWKMQGALSSRGSEVPVVFQRADEPSIDEKLRGNAASKSDNLKLVTDNLRGWTDEIYHFLESSADTNLMHFVSRFEQLRGTNGTWFAPDFAKVQFSFDLPKVEQPLVITYLWK